jgi:uncharacterized protein YdcH (DUF465 family)
MSSTPHHIAEDFPEYATQLRRLRERDGHFERICSEYEEVNHKVHKAEADIEPCDDLHMVALRKRRMALKDEIFGMLTRAEPLAETIG